MAVDIVDFDLTTFRLQHSTEYERGSPCFGCAGAVERPLLPLPAINRIAPIKQLTDANNRTFYATSQVVTPYTRDNVFYTNSYHPLLSATSGLCAYVYNYLDGNGNLSDTNNLDLMPHAKCNVSWPANSSISTVTNASAVNCFMHRGDFVDYTGRTYAKMLTVFPLVIPTTKIKTQFYNTFDDCIHVGYGGTFETTGDQALDSQWPISGTSWPYIYFNNLTKFRGKDDNIWGCSKWALVYAKNCTPVNIANSGCWNYYNSGVPEFKITYNPLYHNAEGYLYHNERYDSGMVQLAMENDASPILASFYLRQVTTNYYFIWQETQLPKSLSTDRSPTQIVTPPLGISCTIPTGTTNNIEVRFIQFGMEINKKYSLFTGDTN